MLTTELEGLIECATGDRNGMGPATPHIVSITPDVADSGVATAIIACISSGAVRVAVSTSFEPSAATVRGAPLQQLDGAGVLRTGTLATLIPGQTLYIAALAYEKADGSANESPLVAAQAAMRYLPTLSLLHTGPAWKATRLFVAWTGNAGVGSVKVATSTSSYPAAGTGTSQDGAENLFDAGTFSYGDTVYITVTPYSGAGATGNQGPALQYRARLKAFPRPDFNPHQMLPNAGFEDGAVLWRDNVAGSSSVVTDSTKAHSGNKYLQVSAATGQFGGAFAADDAGATRFFEVQPGDVVQFGGYAYRESGSSDVYYVIQVLNKDFTVIGTVSTPTQNTAAYLLVQAEYVVAAGIKYVAVFTEVNHTGTATVARFDDAFLRIPFSKSTAHNPQGSVLPIGATSKPLSYNSAANSGELYWTWSAFTLYRPDGTTISIPASSSMPAPPSPTLSQQAGGAMGVRNYGVRLAYIKGGHISGVGVFNTINLSANNLVVVTSPPAAAGYDGWIPLISLNGTDDSGCGVRTSVSIATPIAFGTNYVEPTTGPGTLISVTAASGWPGKLYAIGLALSTSYLVYPFWDIANGLLLMAGAPVTAGDPTIAQAQHQDGRIAIGDTGMTGVTASAGVPSSGNPAGGNGGRYL